MKRILFLVAILFAAVSGYAQPEAPFVPGELLVQVTDNDQIQKLTEDLQIVHGVETELQVIEPLSKHMRIWKVGYNSEAIQARDMRSAVWKHNLTQVVQYNHYVTLREAPNDPNYGQQWHHDNIESEAAWDVTTGGETAFGDEIVVCVIEGGNLNHPDLEPNKWFNSAEIPDNGIDDDNNGYVDDYDGWNVGSNDDSGVFNGGHGTQVMGMIGAKGDNNLGIAGANWDVKIMSVAGENIGNEGSVIEAYDYPLQMRKRYNETGGAEGAFVVATNASWGIDFGNPADIPLWCQFYDTLGTYGILNCGATSNQNINIDEVGDIPTACASDYMISVTATNSSDVRDFSAFGATTVDLGSPGSGVYTTQGNNGYGNTSGTSFASPLTAGAIALIYSTPCPSFMSLVTADPQAGADYVRQVLFDGTDPVANLEGECVTGGRLNVNNSIQLILNSCSDSECLIPFSLAATADGANTNITWGSLAAMISFDLRYRMVGEMDWTEVNGLMGESYSIADLPWCTEYEVQISANCEEGEESEWSASVFFETEGCCENPDFESIMATNISEDGAVIACEGVLAAEMYNFLITPVGGGDAIEVSSETNSIILDELEACTVYEVQVAVVCADETLAFTQPYTFNTTGCGLCADLDYCPSFGADASEEWVERVAIGTLDNTSGSNQGYGDYTNSPDQTTIVDPGGTYNVTLVPGYSGFEYTEYFVIWMDYNQDGTFTDNEIAYASAEGVTAAVTGEINIPVTASPGSVRMRVSMRYLGFENPEPHDSCDELEFGEVEDYCLTISENIISVDEVSAVNWNIFPNPAGDLVNISAPNGNWNVELTDLAGRIVRTENTQGRVQWDVSDLTSGVYLIRLVSEGKTVGTKKLILQ